MIHIKSRMPLKIFHKTQIFEDIHVVFKLHCTAISATVLYLNAVRIVHSLGLVW